VGGGAFPKGCEAPWSLIFVAVLTIWVPAVLVMEAPDVATGSPGMSRAGLRGWVIIDVPRYPLYKTPTRWLLLRATTVMGGSVTSGRSHCRKGS
jgi:hypothetical protein